MLSRLVVRSQPSTAAWTMESNSPSNNVMEVASLPSSRVSHIEELIRMIMWSLHDQGGRKSLLNFALACKAFREMGLDILWAEQDSVVPLLSLVKNWHWKKTRIESTGRTFYELCHFGEPPWDFGSWPDYARRIKSFTWNSRYGVGIDDTSLRCFMTLIPEGVQYWPNLRHLTVRDGSHSFQDALNTQILILRTLRSITLKTQVPEFLWQVFEELCDGCQDLQSLSVTSDLFPGISNFVWDSREYDKRLRTYAWLYRLLLQNNLVRFVCGTSLVEHFVVALGEMTRLKEMDVIIDGQLGSLSAHALPVKCFPALEDLTVQFYRLEDTSHKLMTMISSTKLVKLTLIISEVHEKKLENCVKALAQFGALRHLHLVLFDDERRNPPPYIAQKSLDPILTLSNLRSLKLRMPCLLIGMSGYDEIVRALPHLEDLRILDYDLSTYTDPPAYHSLMDIAEHSPNLLKLFVPVDDSSVPPLPPSFRSTSRVNKIYLYQPVVRGREAPRPVVSDYLAALFPETPRESIEVINPNILKNGYVR
ncbi:uncharacterized protein LAESUDRAFT_110530 [Laetiporus sulphureus 93-53]|uniref:F-box domain-containing protein n=1 Tax=Laetiporus sulphureus 93-53 TaxID=1314785 RepID=A0A165EP12_9APHY|nr:uncharacterized protein LAESUDRAFT_110530 [Laetiporus sulphureus 93-53]KZT07462.1 hypothetical protein LAESUDRAFT_110530 [Laetiporus sulphureus 93-53]